MLKTAKLEQKQRLARELQIEREASFHQRQFMGMVAHEFRTPLAVIQAALENLRPLGGLDQPGGALRSHWPRRHPPGAAHR
ncbi:histidine kinase [Klebsiella pneumoniae subsp. pneumoniae]|nr:histidine kinase [Klebsiella pneumoniae subsp. pneumoniae]